MLTREQIVTGFRRILRAVPLRGEPLPCDGSLALRSESDVSAGRVITVNRAYLEAVVELLGEKEDGPVETT